MSEQPADAALGHEASGASDVGETQAARPGLWAWLHSSHPTVAALLGFYIGLAYAIVVPGIGGAVLSWLFGRGRAEDLFPWLALTLLVPLAMLVPRKTRRLAQFVWIGIVSTVVVVVGVGGAVFWFLVQSG